MKEAYDALVAARKLIANPRNWCTGAYAKDAHDNYIPATHDKACKWCAMGAMFKTTDGFDHKELNFAHARLTEAAKELYRSSEGLYSVPQINDIKGHGAVMKMYDLAILNARLETTDERY